MPIQDTHAAAADQGKVLCFVCEADLTERNLDVGKGEKVGKEKIRPGIVEINSEGTGFASAGDSLVKKDGVSFQC